MTKPAASSLEAGVDSISGSQVPELRTTQSRAGLVSYALTVFLGAFLLFEIEPILGKLLLPWFGGSAAVWTACLVYFQIALLAGYLYAHGLTSYLKRGHQAIVHSLLLQASLVLLGAAHFAVPGAETGANPTAKIFLLLTVWIGLPFLLLSATGPLIQSWYASVRPGSITYRLYALSNLGSIAALLSYPFLIEPALRTTTQLRLWSIAYAVFAMACSVSAWRTSRVVQPERFGATIGDQGPTRWPRILLWMALAACPAGLLLAITAEVTHNIAPIPLLWILPLAVYLLTFVLCFEFKNLYRPVFLLPLLILVLFLITFTLGYGNGNPPLGFALSVFMAGLFVCCMFCHGELARLKPPPRYLTAFYLSISVGGAAGGLLVAVVAPRLLSDYYELPGLIVYCAVLAAVVVWRNVRLERPLRTWIVRVWMIAFMAVLTSYLHQQFESRQASKTWRNFYGVLRLREAGDRDNSVRMLINGTITHGLQITTPEGRRRPTAYYGVNSGVGKAVSYLRKDTPLMVGVIGLGAGVLASYCREGDQFRFYEINPLVIEIAKREFTFLADCPSVPVIKLGDARLVLERESPQAFDLLVIDAFSSDSVPVHLLTKEAFQLYFKHLRPSALLAINVLNRYLDLTRVVVTNVQSLGRTSILVHDEGNNECCLQSNWVLVSSVPSANAAFRGPGIYSVRVPPGLEGWTDDYSGLAGILKR